MTFLDSDVLIALGLLILDYLAFHLDLISMGFAMTIAILVAIHFNTSYILNYLQEIKEKSQGGKKK